MADEVTLSELARNQDRMERRFDAALTKVELSLQTEIGRSRSDCQAVAQGHLDTRVYTSDKSGLDRTLKELSDRVEKVAESVKWANRAAIGAFVTLLTSAIVIIATRGA